MDIISIKVHPPWYARGTPIVSTRDGPPFDLSAYVVSRRIGTSSDNVKMEAIREGPSARGKPTDLIHLWLTLKTTFFNMQKGVYGQWYAQFFDAVKSKDVDRSEERSADDFDFDLSACADIGMGNKPKTRRVDKIIEMEIIGRQKPRRGDKIIEMYMIYASKTRRVDMIIEKSMNDEQQKYHPLGVSIQQCDLCYNPTIPGGIKNQIHQLAENVIRHLEIICKPKTRRVDMIIEMDIIGRQKPRRVDKIIEMYIIYASKTRRGDKIIEKSMNDEQQKYHPRGFRSTM